MFIQGKRVAAIAISRQHLKDAAFIAGAKQALLEKHAGAIEGSEEEPQFYVEGVGSSLNSFRSLISLHDVDFAEVLLQDVLFPSRIKRYRE